MENYKALEDNIGKNLGDLRFVKNSLDKTAKTWSMKEKVGKLNFIGIKNFCSAKNTVKKMKRQTTDWEKIFVKHLSNNGLLSEIYKELFKLNSKKTAIQFKIGYKIWIDTSAKKI